VTIADKNFWCFKFMSEFPPFMNNVKLKSFLFKKQGKWNNGIMEYRNIGIVGDSIAPLLFLIFFRSL